MGYRPPKKQRDLSIDEMIALRKQGVTLREIGERLHISRQRVQMIIGPTRSIKPRKTKPTPEEREAAKSKRKIEKFWSLVKTASPDECWEWQGRTHPVTGYGSLTFNSKQVYAHRVAYELTNGKIPEGKNILHSCDNPKCCNPAHLRSGTQQENMEDRDKRKRAKARTGCAAYYRQRNKEIVEQYGGSLDEIPALAQRFGVGGSEVYNVILRARRKSEASNV